MAIKLIAAIDSNNSLGFENNLLFHIPNDLKRFKELTSGNIVLFGRKSYESLPVQPLPNRLNVVLTRDINYKVPPNVFITNSVDHILNHYATTNDSDKDLFICGGANVYTAFMPYADEVYLTYIDKTAENADTFFNRKMLEELFYITKFEKNYCNVNELDFYYATYKNKNHYVHRVDEFK